MKKNEDRAYIKEKFQKLKANNKEKTARVVYYKELKFFIERNGHSKIPYNYPRYPRLRFWVDQQNYFEKNRELSPKHRQELIELGFKFDSGSSQIEYEKLFQRKKEKFRYLPWERRFNDLVQFKKINGHCNIPFFYEKDPTLGHWCREQRRQFKKGNLTKLRQKKLQEIGFVFDVYGDANEKHLQELKDFYKRYHHTNVPQLYPKNPSLGHWCQRQRLFKKKGKLSQDMEHQLEAIQFVWKPKTIRQHVKNESYKKLKNLARWYERQKRAGNLFIHRPNLDNYYQLLDKKILEKNKSGVKDYLKSFVAYYKQHGHGYVGHDTFCYLGLASWCSRMRIRERRGLLSEKEKQKLITAGFEFDYKEAYWKSMYLALKKIYQRYHSSNVTQFDPANAALKRWCARQRKLLATDMLSNEHKRKLEKIHFEFN